MWPFTLLEHLAQLSKVSLLAFASLAYVFVAVMWVCFTDPALAESVQQAQPVLLSPRGFLAVPVMALAYCAQVREKYFETNVGGEEVGAEGISAWLRAGPTGSHRVVVTGRVQSEPVDVY